MSTQHPLHPHTGVELAPVFWTRDGVPRYPILGGAPEEEDPSNDNTGGNEAKFTQDDLDRIAREQRARGQRRGAEETAAELGFENAEAMREFVRKQKEAEEANRTEAERREAAAADRERKLAAREAAAAEKERTSLIRVALRHADVTDPNDIADAERLLTIPDDADDEALQKAVDDLLQRRPELKTTPGKTPPPGPRGLLPGGTGPKPRVQSANTETYGERRAKRNGWTKS